MPYAPEAGDLIWAIDPRIGREQSGRGRRWLSRQPIFAE